VGKEKTKLSKLEKNHGKTGKNRRKFEFGLRMTGITEKRSLKAECLEFGFFIIALSSWT
jgi:hypothetical protein